MVFEVYGLRFSLQPTTSNWPKAYAFSIMDTQQALDILGLSGNPSLAEVKKAYREQVKLWHPDRYSNGSAMKHLAEKNIQDANLAYDWLKRRLPSASTASKARQTRRPRQPSRPAPSTPAPEPLDRLTQIFDWIGRRFPRLELRPILHWLRHDARNRFRPWYRYPDSADDDGPGNASDSFDRALQRALRNPSAIKRIQRPRSTSPTNDQDDSVTPIGRVSKSDKSPRT